MSRKTKIIVGSSALALLLTTAAQAREVAFESRFSSSCMIPTSSTSECTAEGKGTFGGSVSQSAGQFGALGPPSERCAGYDFEILHLSGSSITTFGDLSQLYGVQTSGFTCVNLDGTEKIHVEGTILGGTGRFEGASGTISQDSEGLVLNLGTFPHQVVSTGTTTGTITLP